MTRPSSAPIPSASPDATRCTVVGAARYATAGAARYATAGATRCTVVGATRWLQFVQGEVQARRAVRAARQVRHRQEYAQLLAEEDRRWQERRLAPAFSALSRAQRQAEQAAWWQQRADRLREQRTRHAAARAAESAEFQRRWAAGAAGAARLRDAQRAAARDEVRAGIARLVAAGRIEPSDAS